MENIRKSEDQEPPIAGFEKLWIWQRSYKLMQEIHEFSKVLPREEKFRLRDQIERSSSSVPDNIAEGHSSYYYNDKIKGMNTARKEAGETQNHIRKCEGRRYLDSKKANIWIKEYEEIIRGINGYNRYVREKKKAKQ